MKLRHYLPPLVLSLLLGALPAIAQDSAVENLPAPDTSLSSDVLENAQSHKPVTLKEAIALSYEHFFGLRESPFVVLGIDPDGAESHMLAAAEARRNEVEVRLKRFLVNRKLELTYITSDVVEEIKNEPLFIEFRKVVLAYEIIRNVQNRKIASLVWAKNVEGVPGELIPIFEHQLPKNRDSVRTRAKNYTTQKLQVFGNHLIGAFGFSLAMFITNMVKAYQLDDLSLKWEAWNNMFTTQGITSLLVFGFVADIPRHYFADYIKYGPGSLTYDKLMKQAQESEARYLRSGKILSQRRARQRFHYELRKQIYGVARNPGRETAIGQFGMILGSSATHFLDKGLHSGNLEKIWAIKREMGNYSEIQDKIRRRLENPNLPAKDVEELKKRLDGIDQILSEYRSTQWQAAFNFFKAMATWQEDEKGDFGISTISMVITSTLIHGFEFAVRRAQEGHPGLSFKGASRAQLQTANWALRKILPDSIFRRELFGYTYDRVYEALLGKLDLTPDWQRDEAFLRRTNLTGISGYVPPPIEYAEATKKALALKSGPTLNRVFSVVSQKVLQVLMSAKGGVVFLMLDQMGISKIVNSVTYSELFLRKIQDGLDQFQSALKAFSVEAEKNPNFCVQPNPNSAEQGASDASTGRPEAPECLKQIMSALNSLDHAWDWYEKKRISKNLLERWNSWNMLFEKDRGELYARTESLKWLAKGGFDCFSGARLKSCNAIQDLNFLLNGQLMGLPPWHPRIQDQVAFAEHFQKYLPEFYKFVFVAAPANPKDPNEANINRVRTMVERAEAYSARLTRENQNARFVLRLESIRSMGSVIDDVYFKPRSPGTAWWGYYDQDKKWITSRPGLGHRYLMPVSVQSNFEHQWEISRDALFNFSDWPKNMDLTPINKLKGILYKYHWLTTGFRDDQTPRKLADELRPPEEGETKSKSSATETVESPMELLADELTGYFANMAEAARDLPNEVKQVLEVQLPPPESQEANALIQAQLAKLQAQRATAKPAPAQAKPVAGASCSRKLVGSDPKKPLPAADCKPTGSN